MGNYLDRTTKDYLKSVSPASLSKPLADYISEPDLSAVMGHPAKHWTITGDVVSLMPQGERDTVDAAEAQAATDADRAAQRARMDNERLLKAMAVYFAKQLNKLDDGTFTRLTATAVKTGIKDEVDNV